jgi:hypothetical protein
MDHEAMVRERVEKITAAEKAGSYARIREELLQKRLGWYEQNKDRLDLKGSDVRKAYALVLFEYMHIDPKEVPVTYEDERKITWVSHNFCPILEACNRLGLDTRKVCKVGWEESVQALIEKINPKLRFSRNYNALRPHGDYCEETIMLEGSRD